MSVQELGVTSTYCSSNSLETTENMDYFECPEGTSIGYQINIPNKSAPVSSSLNLAVNPFQVGRQLMVVIKVIQNKFGGRILHINFSKFNIRMMFAKKTAPNHPQVIEEVKKLSLVESLQRSIENSNLTFHQATKVIPKE
jgi:hypothetical protein